MKAITCSIVTFLLLCVGCAVQGTKQLKTSDQRPCAQNMTYDGSILTGRTFNTHDFVKGVSKNTAVERAVAFTSSEGLSIINVDERLGIISAEQTVSHSDGKKAAEPF